MDLKPGMYRLTQDIINPKPDKRKGQTQYINWHYWEKLPRGLRLYIKQAPGYKNDYWYMENGDGANRSRFVRYLNEKLWDSIITNVEPDPESAMRMLFEDAGTTLSNSADDVLIILINTQKVSLDDIKGALEIYNKEAEEDYNRYLNSTKRNS